MALSWASVDSIRHRLFGAPRDRDGEPLRVTIAAIDLADRKLAPALAKGPASATSGTARPLKTGTKRGTRRVEKTAPATRRPFWPESSWLIRGETTPKTARNPVPDPGRKQCLNACPISI
jgi:hypothetical protein